MTDYTEADAAAERYRRLANGEQSKTVYVTEDGRPEEWAKALQRYYRDGAALAAAWPALRTENARLAADLAAARAERDRIREALAWAVGFIRCNLPKTSAGYEDMRNAEDLVKGVSMSGEFHRLSCRAELAETQFVAARAERDDLRTVAAKAEKERDDARQAAADWRLLAECCALRGVMQFLTAMRHINEVASGHDGLRFALTFLAADSHRGDITRSLVDAARRLAAPHLNPPAEGGAK